MNGLGRPTAAVRRVDVSSDHREGSAVPASSEADLIWASRNGSVLRTEACVCGGLVMADPDSPAYGVQAHNYTSRHRGWRAVRES